MSILAILNHFAGRGALKQQGLGEGMLMLNILNHFAGRGALKLKVLPSLYMRFGFILNHFAGRGALKQKQNLIKTILNDEF